MAIKGHWSLESIKSRDVTIKADLRREFKRCLDLDRSVKPIYGSVIPYGVTVFLMCRDSVGLMTGHSKFGQENGVEGKGTKVNFLYPYQINIALHSCSCYCPGAAAEDPKAR